MALNELELRKAELVMARFLKTKRPPAHIREELDIGYKIINQSIEIFEIRRDFLDPLKKREVPVAKATFVNKSRKWKVYWMRSDLKWHSYPLTPEVATLEEFIRLVEDDESGCFWG